MPEHRIISAIRARDLNLTKYFTGRPCPRGHISERFTLNNTCVECSRERSACWRNNNRARARELSAKWAKDNPERRRLADKLKHDRYKAEGKKNERWRLQDPEQRKAAKRLWNRRNPIKARAYAAKRRTLKRVSDKHYKEAEILSLAVAQRSKCANCRASIRKFYHIDHITPLCLGGSNGIKNIQLLCAPCNLSKGGKDPLVWARFGGKLL